jgi:hypothetical protein
MIAYSGPIDCGVTEALKESLRGFGQEDELLNALHLGIVFEARDEFPAQAALAMLRRHGQGTQQRLTPEAFEANHTQDRTHIVYHPRLKFVGAPQIGGRQSGGLKQPRDRR